MTVGVCVCGWRGGGGGGVEWGGGGGAYHWAITCSLLTLQMPRIPAADDI